MSVLHSKSFRKQRKSTRRHHVKRGGKVIGNGVQGCIIDSLRCGEFSNELGYVAKVVKKGIKDSKKDMEFAKIQEILRKHDPHEERFAYYHIQTDSMCDIKDNFDVKECELKTKSEVDTNRFFMTKKLMVVDPLKLNRKQYRHLRDSINILREIGIIHGDLPDNIMLNSLTNLPIIIDWDSSILLDESSGKYKHLDMATFLNKTNFAVEKI
jgi:serine/threonine protein kinase